MLRVLSFWSALACGILCAGAAPDTIVLWPQGAPDAAGGAGDTVPALKAFFPPREHMTGAAVVVCPGGGYGALAPHEGAPVAEWLNSLGVAGFVLTYRHAPRYKHPAPLRDAQRAIRAVRAGADAWGLDRRVGILGFSAGGHLATTAATHFDAGNAAAPDPIDRESSRPDLAIPIYPVVTMGAFTHQGSRRNLLGEDPSPALLGLLSNETQVTRETPPMFLVHTYDDAAVPVENSLLLAAALRKAGVPFELHLYERGPHGFGLGGGDRILGGWPERCADWLRLHGWANPATAAPAPCPPVPAPRQLAWQRDELWIFTHFGVNTFTDKEWGDGTEDPKIFNPARFDAHQWAATAKDAGFKGIILTAKHHDGFCLWPTAQTEHCLRNSPWRDGKGDVVREVADACRAAGLKFGFYLSPWDRNSPKYEDGKAYDDYFAAQLEELLTGYGPVSEVWFDGAGSEGHVYDWQRYYAAIRRHQPGAVIAICGPDVRWVGNEDGVARETEWSVRDADAATGPGQDGKAWHPAECDVSIRPGWFWHQSQDGQVKSLARLLDIYYKSVGRNAGLLLNVPPTSEGRFAAPDAARLREFRLALDATFATDLARGKPCRADAVRGGDPGFGPARAVDGDPRTYWAVDDDIRQASIEIDLEAPAACSVCLLGEAIELGQRIEAHRVEVLAGGQWRTVARGTTVGYKRLHRFPAVEARRLRVTIERARACPTLTTVGLFIEPEELRPR
ncbi:MAG TPA: alpha-L-fucosidase [Planctomycetota bacterium]|nr:alpha-L-fucosidase [Planctomycetota bacterium]